MNDLLRALSLCTVFFTVPVRSQWTQVPSGTTDDLRCITVAPDGDLYATGLYTVVRHSGDGGQTWTGLGGISGLVYALFFTQPDVGFAAGMTALSNDNILARTIDGGATWQPAAIPAGAWPRGIFDVHFPSASVGYAVGESGRLFKSMDNGATWVQLASGISVPIHKVRFWNELVGIVATSNGIRRTTDGGGTWTDIPNAPTIPAIELGPGNAALGVSTDELLISPDQGLTWNSLWAPFSGPSAIHVLDAQNMIVAATNGIFRTTSGGLYWESFPAPANLPYNDLKFVSPATGCAVGDGGTVISTTNGGGQGIPVARIEHGSMPQCGHTDLLLTTAGDPGWSYTWILNGDTISTASSATVAFTAPSNPVQVELVTSNGAYSGSDTWTSNIAVQLPITVDAGPDLNLCDGNTAALSATGATGYSWSPVTGLSNASIPNPQFIGIGSQTYVISGTTGVCSDEDTLTITVGPEIPMPTWELLLNAPTNGCYNLAMDWTDYLNGFVGQTSNSLARTQDGGATWTSHPIPSHCNLPVKRIEMVDPFVGYLTSTYDLYKTTDGWDTLTISLSISGLFDDVRFLNRDTGYAVGHGGNFITSVHRTVDGGSTWSLMTGNAGGYLREFIVLGTDTLLAIEDTQGQQLALSTDGGASWSFQTVPGFSSINTIAIKPDGDLLAAGGDGWATSFDRGITWNVQGGPDFPFDVAFLDSSSWVAYGFLNGNYALLRTTNAGGCWQVMDTTLFVWSQFSLDLLTSGAGDVVLGHSRADTVSIFRTGMLPAHDLGFSLSKYTICLGDTIRTMNTSLGYDTWEWYVNGTLSSVLQHPVLQPGSVGTQAVMLIASDNGQSDTSLTYIDVRPALPPPLITQAGPICWNSPILFTTSNIADGVVYHWQGGLGYYNVVGTYPADTIIPSYGPNADGWILQVTDIHGCISPWSDSAFVVPSFPPDPGPIIGPDQVCTDTVGTTMTEYSVANLPGLTYTWGMNPPAAGSISSAANIATITWTSGYSNTSAHVNLSLTDQCGTTSGGYRQIEVGPMNRIVDQPDDQSVLLGGNATFSVYTEFPAIYCGNWFLDGQVLNSVCLDHTITNADPTDAGWYHWEGDVIGGCGTLVSDSAELIVDLNVGSIEKPALNGSFVGPNPSSGQIRFEYQDTPMRSVELLDVTGRSVLRKQLFGATQGILDLSYLQQGKYALIFSTLTGEVLCTTALLTSEQ